MKIMAESGENGSANNMPKAQLKNSSGES